MRDMGLVHLYTGEGKGKTTAAVGLAARMSGRGGRVVFAQFLKGGDSGERAALALLPGVTLMPAPDSVKFVFQMNAAERAAFAHETERLFAASCVKAADKDMLILDELLGAIESGLISCKRVADFLANKPAALEVVLTGRHAPEALIALADYVSCAACVKHPYERGVQARAGIEY